MTADTILNVILIILIADFLLERTLDFFNSRHWSADLPESLKGIYDEEEYRKSQQYKREKERVGLISSLLSFAIVMGMILLGGFAWVDSFVRQFVSHPIPVALGFFGLILFASNLIGLPFSLYSTFVIEEKYGFNRTTIKTFVLDSIKAALIGIVIGGGILSLIIWIYLLTTVNFWWMAWAVVGVFMLLVNMFYSTLIVPMFNKQTPLEEGELRNAIGVFSNKVGFQLDNVFVMDGSKRSSKGNAYFSGLGRKKRIVLFDTLINDLETEEIVAVLAHEIGHYKMKHTLSGLIIGLLQTGLMFFLLSLLIGNPELSIALGGAEASFHMGLIAFGILYSPFSMIIGLGMNMWSRYNEYQADDFAARNYNGEVLGDALKKLSVKSLSNLTPHPVYVFFYYSHPTLLQRLKAITRV
jgi:STE24 endopeptidase